MSERDGTILVTGATGSTGSALVRELVARGAPVTAMVRGTSSTAPQGAATVVADFDDAASLAAALRGVRAAYLVTPSSERAQEQQERFVEVAAAQGVEHLVVLSQYASVEDSPVRFLRYHAAVERRVRELGVGHTFLRPNLYFQGLLAFADMIREQGRFMAPIGDARVSAVDVRDIAAVAAVVLTEPGHVGRSYEITGPTAVTHEEIATAIGAATGRPVEFLDVPPEAFAAALRGVLPDWQVDGLLEDYAHYARGEAARVFPSVAEVTGTPARDVATFARDHAAAFGG
ncbi:SDR family oxidoreductase [Pseudonocardia humida]|uniref:SDR family oxidoreductase n=1 Tax=Pseudonocardia humida TaxID=2800819 RepID=A0ABT1ADG3_9PSEU|nr:SDR family oxidoreductase [Pseudonocardia humida]MCO1660963.1 SDR family oxidoreductase [Pseudonocardia humida]